MTYRVFKSNGTKCIRKFESIDEAQEWCWTANASHSYRIEFQYEGESEPRRIFV